MEFKLPYWVSNGGDGSANVCFEETVAKAKKLDREQSEGWGESSASFLSLKVEDNKLFFWGFVPDPEDPDEVDGDYGWVEVKEVKPKRKSVI